MSISSLAKPKLVLDAAYHFGQAISLINNRIADPKHDICRWLFSPRRGTHYLPLVTLKTPVRLGPQYAKLPSCILSFTLSFLLRNQASILIFSSTLNKDIILLLCLITRLKSLYIIVLSLVTVIITAFYILPSSITFIII
jgi:hypothetical protein